nr:LuxR C-terminal-related transcriptional regulator [Arsukibacterium perlucidum]
MQPGLTKRDMSILALASYGLSHSEIAKAVETGIGAIKNRLSNIYDKIGVTNRLAALTLLQQRD